MKLLPLKLISLLLTLRLLILRLLTLGLIFLLLTLRLLALRLLTLGTLALFIPHTFLWGLRELIAKRRRRREDHDE